MRTIPLMSCAVILACGIVALLAWGLNPPPWMLGLEAALLVGSATVFGFTAWLPDPRPLLRLRPVKGTLLVILGIVAMYMPAQLCIAAVLIGIGIRLVWASACELAADGARAGIGTDMLRVPARSAGAPQVCQEHEIQGRDRSFHGLECIQER